MKTALSRRQFLRLTTGTAAGLVFGQVGPRAADVKPRADVVVLLPGIGGSVLRRNERDVWALSRGGLWGAIRTLGGSLDALKLAQDPPDADHLGDGVTADRLFDDVHILPGFWKIDGYGKIRSRLTRELELEPDVNFFEFPYDWRRDNRVAARRLARLSKVWLKSWRTRSGNQDAKLVLLAHSMGGLVARYFLECLDGWRDTRKLITFGTPYRGSLNALNFLSNGLAKSLAGVEIANLSPLLRSFTSVYQLLPRYPCYDPGDGQPVRVGETTGIPNVEAARAAEALAFYHEIDHAVEEHRRDNAYLQNPYKIHPVVGTYQTTLQIARLKAGKLELSTTYPGEDFDGDGTVPRVSATPLELSGANAELFVPQVHGSLQNTDGVIAQIVGLIKSGNIDWSRFRDDPPTPLALTMDDLYADSEPIPVVCRGDTKAKKLIAVMTNTATGAEAGRETLQPQAHDHQRASFRPLPAGSYRITVSGEGAAPVTDVFLVRANERP